jgi:hypothetical protein
VNVVHELKGLRGARVLHDLRFPFGLARRGRYDDQNNRHNDEDRQERPSPARRFHRHAVTGAK